MRKEGRKIFEFHFSFFLSFTYVIFDILVATGPGIMHCTVTPYGAASAAKSSLNLIT